MSSLAFCSFAGGCETAAEACAGKLLQSAVVKTTGVHQGRAGGVASQRAEPNLAFAALGFNEGRLRAHSMFNDKEIRVLEAGLFAAVPLSILIVVGMVSFTFGWFG